MTNPLSTKLAALALALSVNVIMIVGVGLLFSANVNEAHLQALV